MSAMAPMPGGVPDSLTTAIESLYDAIAEIGDPALTDRLTTCLSQMTAVQKELMSGGGGGGEPQRQAVMNQLAAPQMGGY